MKSADAMGDKNMASRLRVSLAQLALQQGRIVDAEQYCQTSVAQKTDPDIEASGRAVLAESLAAAGRRNEAQEEIGRADEVAQKTLDRDLRLSVSITAARIRGASGQPTEREEAIKNLQRIIDEAKAFGFVGRQFEARLAVTEIEKQVGEVQRIDRLDILQKDAQIKGYNLIAMKVAAQMAPSHTLAVPKQTTPH
jgi:hypothetical protein